MKAYQPHGNISSAERCRASKQAALAFLGRVQLGNKLYKEAAKTYKAIIDLGDNKIDPKFSGLFDGTNELNAEIIFATQYVKDLAPNAMSQHFFPVINFSNGKFGWERLSSDLQNSGIALPVVRYAEVLLSYLEVKLEVGDAIGQALLSQTINAVRSRADVNMAPVTELFLAKLREITRR